MKPLLGIRSEFLSGAALVTEREMRDQLRDWRILAPIVMLTLFFPLLMNFTARQAVDFVERYGADIVADRLIPFLLMIVGFFPISISLVIALESFAGERERLSLEPLLAAPLSDGQLYLGKMMASLFVPLAAAYLGIFVYLAGLAISIQWFPPSQLLAQVLLLTSVQALVMVSGAVVVSSQTTSVRAANLLASVIIVPMSQLIIGESLIMFWGQYSILWWIVFGLIIISVILARMGLHLFNREHLLGREIDVLDLRWTWRTFSTHFKAGATGVSDWFLGVLTRSLPRIRVELGLMILAFIAAYLLGTRFAQDYRLPQELIRMDEFGEHVVDQMNKFGLFSSRGWQLILLNNMRAILAASLLGVFSFGVLAVILLMIPIGLVGYFAGSVSLAGEGAGRFLLALVAPHGILEIPAALLAGAVILRLGMAVVSRPKHGSLGESWLRAMAEWCRVMLALILPLLVVAAALEVFLTPRLAILLLGQP